MKTSSSGTPAGRHRRAHADARDAGPRRAAEPVDAHREDAGERRLAPERNVRRRKAQVAPELRAVRDAARDRERPAEQRAGAREIARRQRRAHGRRRRALAVDRHGAHRLDAERPRGARAASRGRPRAPCRSGSPRRPAPSATPSRRTSTSSMNASGVSAASRPSKRATIRPRDAVRAEVLELGAQRRQPRRRGVPGEELARLRIERQHRRRQRRSSAASMSRASIA